MPCRQQRGQQHARRGQCAADHDHAGGAQAAHNGVTGQAPGGHGQGEGGVAKAGVGFVEATFGHQKYHYLDGGLLAWLEGQHPVSTDVPAPVGGPVSLTLHDGPTATREYLQSRLGAADLGIWDARGPLEYSGEKVLAAKGGHIPGAVNFEWTAGMDPIWR